MDVVRATTDVSIARAAVRALARIGTGEAMEFLPNLNAHPAKRIREEVKNTHGRRRRIPVTGRGSTGQKRR
jgi:hypothetical protein